MTPCPTDLALEIHRRDPAASPCRDHVASCPECTARLAVIEQQEDQFQRYMFPATVDRIRAGSHATVERPSWRRWLWLPALAASAAGIALFARPFAQHPSYDGTKGGHLFQVFARTPDGAQTVTDHGAVPRSAVLRFEATPPAPCWFTIVSVDGRGDVSKLFPEDADASLVSSAGALPGGAVLDDAVGPERVFALCAPAPLTLEQIALSVHQSVAIGDEAIRATRKVAGLPENVVQESVLIEKGL